MRPNYVLKPTAGERSRFNQPLSAGGGLARRWAAVDALSRATETHTA